MKIAVTYENGQVFQHFGRTEQFKIYEVENDRVVSAQVVSSDGAGHEALAGVLEQLGVNALLCGGIGDGAMTALSDAGIEVCSGCTGETDAAVESYLKGELLSDGINCDHHHEEEESEEGCGCGGNCGGGCGGGCGGCGGGMRILLEGPNAGKTVRVHYRGTFNDGTQFDASYDRGEPLEFVCGAGMMIPGFDAAVVNMTVGQEIDIHLMPEEAYGPADPRAVFTVELAQLPGAEELSIGERVYLYSQDGRPFPVSVADKTETTITFDANPEMAGKELNFHIELLEVKD